MRYYVEISNSQSQGLYLETCTWDLLGQVGEPGKLDQVCWYGWTVNNNNYVSNTFTSKHAP